MLSDPNHLKKGLIFVATHSFFPGHILLNSSDSIVPNTFSLVSSLNTFPFFFPGLASIPLEFFSFLTFFIKYFLKFLNFCLQYPALSRLATAFIGDNPIKIALKTFLFISWSIYSGSSCVWPSFLSSSLDSPKFNFYWYNFIQFTHNFYPLTHTHTHTHT